MNTAAPDPSAEVAQDAFLSCLYEANAIVKAYRDAPTHDEAPAIGTAMCDFIMSVLARQLASATAAAVGGDLMSEDIVSHDGKAFSPVEQEAFYTPAAPVGGFVVVLSPDEINNLPERVRAYIASLETEADHAGTIRDNFMLREENKALRKHIETHDVSDLIREFIACDGDSFARGSVAIRIAGKLEKAESASPAAHPSVVGPAQTESEFQRMRRVVGDIRRGVEVKCVNDNPAAQSSAKDGARVDGHLRHDYSDNNGNNCAICGVTDWNSGTPCPGQEATTAAGLVYGLHWRKTGEPLNGYCGATVERHIHGTYRISHSNQVDPAREWKSYTGKVQSGSEMALEYGYIEWLPLEAAIGREVGK